jgi:hypothetical protein
MADKRVDFEVDTKAQAFWIAVDKHDVNVTNGKGSITLPTQTQPYMLVWWFQGNAGTSFSAKGMVGQKTVVEVKDSKIPTGQHSGAGTKRFLLK